MEANRILKSAHSIVTAELPHSEIQYATAYTDKYAISILEKKY